MTVPAAVQPHEILLTYGRRLLWDQDGDRFRVAYYIPQGGRAELKRLAKLANRGDRQAAEQLRAMPQSRFVSADTTLRAAVRAALTLGTPASAEREAVQVLAYARDLWDVR